MQNFNGYQGCGWYNTYQQPQQSNFYAFVDGIEGARAYQCRPNSMMLLMDSLQPICYKKQTDMYGKTISIEVYDLVPHQEKPPVEYVSLDTFNKEIADLKALIGKGE